MHKTSPAQGRDYYTMAGDMYRILPVKNCCSKQFPGNDQVKACKNKGVPALMMARIDGLVASMSGMKHCDQFFQYFNRQFSSRQYLMSREQFCHLIIGINILGKGNFYL